MGSYQRAILLLLIFLIVVFQGSVVVAESVSEPPPVAGEGAVLLDVETGRLLWGENEHQSLPPASTTKVMTVLLGLELGQPEELVIISEVAQSQTGSRVYLTAGEEYTLRELLYAVQLASANDAAVAVAEHLTGSVEDFTRLMNQRARELGAKNTNFVNPNGLPEPNHRTTAYDLALIARAALHNSDFREIITTRSYPMSWPGHDEDRLLWNRNRLFQLFEGADGVKTGYTVEAGHCLVGSATREGHQLLTVILGSTTEDIWTDTVALLDYGFATFANQEILQQGAPAGKTEVKYGSAVELLAKEGFIYTLAPGEEELVTTKAKVNSGLEAPLAVGEEVGTLELYLGSEQVGQVPLVTGAAVNRKIYTRWWFWPLALYVPWRFMVAIRRLRRRRWRRKRFP